MKEYLSIGELASIFNITVQLLRHYDAKGLLVPSIRDPETGHRKYHFDQMYMLATIRYLRKLGYPLDSIKQFLAIDNFEKAIGTMREQSEILREKYQDLLLTDNIIQKKLAFISQERGNIVEDEVVYKQFPARHFALIGAETALFTHELFYFYPTIGFYKGQEKKFGAYIIDSPDVISISVWNSHMDRSVLASGKYACYYHFGPYEKIYESIERLRDHLGDVDCPENKTVITINIFDQFITSDQSKYVTELQILVD